MAAPLPITDPITGNTVTRPLLGGEVFASPSERTNWVTDWKDIQPRIGFSFQYDPKTVLRGGYGIYYDQTRSGANGLLSYGSQGFNQYSNLVPTYQNDGATPYLHLSNPFPNGLQSADGKLTRIAQRRWLWRHRADPRLLLRKNPQRAELEPRDRSGNWQTT